MKLNKSILGLIGGIVAGLAIWFIPLDGLSTPGHKCLALTVATVIFWACGVAQPGYVSGLYLLSLVVFKVAEPTLVFSTWTTSMMYLIIGAYLIATAVKESGLGERIAYMFIVRFVTGWKSIIIAIFVLTFILALLIPHPWPRAFLIMGVMAVVIKSADIPKEDGVKIGFAVFTASIPVSMIFLTGDASINPLAAAYSVEPIGWLRWLLIMGPPMVVASLITLVMLLVMFRPTKEVSVNKDDIKEKLVSLGVMTGKEKRALAWVILAIALWMTDTWHGVDIGWVTLFIAMGMAMPVIGGVLTPASWSGVPVQTLIFLTAAVAIGRVGGGTGMNAWLAETILPDSVPSNMFVLAAFITVVAIVIHMVFGSVIAVMGIVIPAMIAFTEQSGVDTALVAMIAYTAVNAHFILPFHNLAILVGVGEDNGGYTEKETVKFGAPFTLVLFILTVAVEIPYWKLIGLW
jgi:anion transporter